MSLIYERLRLKRLLRALMQEAVGDAAMAAIVDRVSEYEAARADYDRWTAERAKYERAADFAFQQGVDPDNAAAMLKLRRQFPEYDYDPKVLKREKLVKDRLRAAHKAARPEYNTGIGELPFVAPGDSDEPIESGVRERRPPANKPIHLSPSQMEPLRLYPWSDFESIGLPPIGGFNDAVGDAHPGEERLAKIFGAERQGDSVSYDLVDQEGLRWEVKGLQRPTSLIRPGVEGIAAAKEATDRLMKVVLEIEAFVDRIEAGNAATVCDTVEQMRRFIALRKFVQREKKDIERKEISAGRFEAIALALENVAALRKAWDYETMKTLKGTLGHGVKNLEVPQLKLIKLLQSLAEEEPEAQELLATYGPRELALAQLETKAAYDSPRDWMNAWDASIDVNRIFNVDGLIIVSPVGFTLVPQAALRDVLELKRLSQDAPRFAFVPTGTTKAGS